MACISTGRRNGTIPTDSSGGEWFWIHEITGPGPQAAAGRPANTHGIYLNLNGADGSARRPYLGLNGSDASARRPYLPVSHAYAPDHGHKGVIRIESGRFWE